MSRVEAFAAGYRALLGRLPWPDHELQQLLLHPRRCAPDAVTYAAITGLPARIVAGLWGTGA